MRYTSLFLRCLVFLGVTLALIDLMVVPPAYAQNFKPSRAAIDAKDWGTAIPLLRAILEDKPKSHEAHYLLGMALKGSGQLDEAFTEFEITVDRQGKFVPGRYELAMMQIDRGMYEEAVKNLGEAEKRSKGKEARIFYAQGLMKARQSRELTEKNGDSGEIKRLQMEARNLMTKAMALESDNTVFVRGLGDVYKEMKVWGMAINQYNKALAMNPNSSDAAVTQYQLGQLHFESRQFNEAVAAYEKASKIDPTITDAWFQQGYIYFLAKSYGRAEQPLRKTLESWPDNFEANYYLAESLNKTKRIKMAVPFYEKALSIDANHADAVKCYSPMAEGLVADGEYEKAHLAYTSAVEQEPENFDLVYGLGWVKSQADIGDYDNAKVYLTKAMTIDPASEKPVIQLALVDLELGNYSEAVPNLKKAISLKPDDHNPYYYLGDAYIKQHLFEDAVTSVREVLEPAIMSQEDEKVKTRLSNVYFQLGQVLFRDKQYPPAISFFQQRIAHDSTYFPAYYNLGLAALVGSDYETARVALVTSLDLKGLELEPAETKAADGDSTELKSVLKQLLQVKDYLGTSYVALKDFRSARPIYKDLLEQDPEHHVARYRMGYMDVVNQSWNSAIQHLRVAVRIRPENASYHLMLAQAYTNSQQLAPAVRAYREVLRIQPGNQTARDQLNTVQEALNAQN
ncbi:MAG: tetratricopeptide repeat protein [Gemmatimonadota bacterium]|nr:tetratricopeptide repeat protein [Gemmatimonadota bacterium]